MNSRIIPSLIAATAGLALGWLAGRGGAGEQSTPVAANGHASAKARTLSSESAEKAPPRSFAAYVQRVANPVEEEEAIAAAARMSTGELQTLLLAMPEFQWNEPSAEYHLQKVAAKAAADELVRREGVAAVDWSVSTNDKEARFLVLMALAAVDPRATHERMLPFNMAYSGYLGSSFGYEALKAAALRGAADVQAVQDLWKDGGSLDQIHSYARDFDFAAYFDKNQEYSGPDAPMTAWAAADPEAAAKSIEKHIHDRPRWSNLLGAALEGRATMVSEAEAAPWACELLQKIPDGHLREEALHSLARDPSNARVEALIQHLPTDRDRLDYIQALFNNDMSGRGTRILAGLQAIDSEAVRVEALIGMNKLRSQGAWTNPEFRTAHIAKIEGMMEKLALSPAAREQWRASIPPES